MGWAIIWEVYQPNSILKKELSLLAMWGGKRNGCVYGEECRLFFDNFFFKESVVGGMIDRYRCDLIQNNGDFFVN